MLTGVRSMYLHTVYSVCIDMDKLPRERGKLPEQFADNEMQGDEIRKSLFGNHHGTIDLGSHRWWVLKPVG